MTLNELLQASPADRLAVALPEPGIEITYGNLRDQVSAMAARFAGLGIGRGDRVAMALGNGLPVLVTMLGASTVATAAPLNPAYRAEEFSFYLEDTNAKLLIVPPEGADQARAAAGDKVPVLVAELDSDGIVTLSGDSVSADVSSPTGDDIALILHTSGSTGRPKRVPLRHRNLTTSAGNVADCYSLSHQDVSMGVMPLFHIHGIVASILATLHAGGAVVLPEKFNPLAFWRVAAEHGVTWYTAVPTIHQLLLSRAEASGKKPVGADGLRFIRSCSAPLAPDVLERLEGAFEVPVLEAYGMTEAAHQMSSNPLPPGPRKAGSVGEGTGVEIRIVDAAGQDVPRGAAGEIVIRGANVIDEYENNPEANATGFFEDWFRTGDQGKVDADGYLSLVGRLKEMINRGGEKISPREVDDVLLAHPAITEAVAFGVPHDRWGEEVEAAVVLDGDIDETGVIAYCRERLAEFKTPKKIHVVESIPKTATGKIQRRIVAAQFTRDTG